MPTDLDLDELRREMEGKSSEWLRGYCTALATRLERAEQDTRRLRLRLNYVMDKTRQRRVEMVGATRWYYRDFSDTDRGETPDSMIGPFTSYDEAIDAAMKAEKEEG